MLMPLGVTIDGMSGAVTPATGRYVKMLSALQDLYEDPGAAASLIAERGDIEAYSVVEYKPDGSDICFGTTIMQPGRVGREYFITRGHYHARADRGEVYYTQSGEGVLLLHNRDGQTQSVAMRPGVCAHIPPGWAHRSVNTGSDLLVFVWMCSVDAGHDYADITANGMRELAIAQDGAAQIIANPKYGSKA